MKVTIDKDERKISPKFPCIMTSDAYNTVVYMIDSEGAGVCISSDLHKEGTYSDWDMHVFTALDGSVTLTN